MKDLSLCGPTNGRQGTCPPGSLSQRLICMCLDACLGKPSQFGGQSGTRSGPIGTRDSKPHYHKGQMNPMSSTEVSSSPGNPPTTVTTSSPFGSVKKVSYPSEHAQKGNNPKSSRRQRGGAESPSQQVCYSFPIYPQNTVYLVHYLQVHSKTAAKSVPGSKNGRMGGSSPATTSAGVPPPAPPQSSTPSSTKTTAYSNAVKKTTGGPSGSLTSEGTEYDESSGEEAAQDENKVANPPESSRFPAPQHNHQKPLKPIPLSRGGGATAAGGQITSSIPRAQLTTTSYQEVESHNVADTTASPQQRQGGQDGSYLERKVPPKASSQPEDAWPVIHEDIPPQNTMIYAAVMTNHRSNQDQAQQPPTISTPPQPQFPYSDTTAGKAQFPGTFISTPLMAVTSRPPLTFPPQTPGMILPHTLPQPSSIGSGALNTGMMAGGGNPLPAGSYPVRTPNQFQSNSSLYGGGGGGSGGGGGGGRVNFSGHSGNNVYSTPIPSTHIPKASSSPHVGYSSNRSLGTNENIPLPFSTEAAGIEMRSMIRNLQMLSPAQPIAVDCSSQTLPPASSEKAVQVAPGMVEESVQTTDVQFSTSESQTTGFFVPMEYLMPNIQNIQVESVGKSFLCHAFIGNM